MLSRAGSKPRDVFVLTIEPTRRGVGRVKQLCHGWKMEGMGVQNRVDLPTNGLETTVAHFRHDLTYETGGQHDRSQGAGTNGRGGGVRHGSRSSEFLKRHKC